MPSNNNNDPSDILGQVSDNKQSNNTQNQNTDRRSSRDTDQRTDDRTRGRDEATEYLKSIDTTLKQIAEDADSISQATAQDYTYDARRNVSRNTRNQSQWSRSAGSYRRSSRNRYDYDPQSNTRYTSSNSRRRNSTNDDFDFNFRDAKRKTQQSVGRSLDKFTDGLEKGFTEAFLGSDYKDKIRGVINDFAGSIGVPLADLPEKFGDELGKKAADALKHMSIPDFLPGAGQTVEEKFNDVMNNAFGTIKSKVEQGVNNYRSQQASQQPDQTSQGDWSFEKMRDFNKQKAEVQDDPFEFIRNRVKEEDERAAQDLDYEPTTRKKFMDQFGDLTDLAGNKLSFEQILEKAEQEFRVHQASADKNYTQVESGSIDSSSYDTIYIDAAYVILSGMESDLQQQPVSDIPMTASSNSEEDVLLGYLNSFQAKFTPGDYIDDWIKDINAQREAQGEVPLADDAVAQLRGIIGTKLEESDTSGFSSLIDQGISTISAMMSGEDQPVILEQKEPDYSNTAVSIQAQSVVVQGPVQLSDMPQPEEPNTNEPQKVEVEQEPFDDNINGLADESNKFEDAFNDWIEQVQSSRAENGQTELTDNVISTLKDTISRELGFDSNAMGKEAGQALTDKMGSLFNNLTKNVTTDSSGKIAEFVESGLGDAVGGVSEVAEAATGAAETAGTAASTSLGSAVAEFGSGLASTGAEVASGALTMGEGVAAAGAGLAGLATVAAPVVAGFLALQVAQAAVTHVLNQFKPAVEGLKSVFEAMSSAWTRSSDETEKRTKNAEARLEADMETLLTEPFDILKEAAQELYDAWDESVREINGTQGYTKSELYDLMESYAERLRDEDLSAVVSTADITENLTKVLESGLSGQVAEEFAYLATVLNAAVPTEDFFDYASTYAQIASLAMQSGMSQSEAIEYANEQITSFASSVLYASRTLSGGFTTGLTNASDLLETAVSIANAANSDNYSEISAVLAAASAYVGSVAPDLATSIVDTIEQLATGGNDSSLTALRSLAGTGASNTSFLNAFADDPQGVLEELFNNLGSMQNMSSTAYMEVAEALSDLFGMSIDELSQIDFEYLADAIASMDLDADSLEENLALLASGETTTSAEAQRMAEINEYMLDEGLSYVLDNEAARTIQQHLWDEELANEMMENEYAVSIKESQWELMSGIKQTLQNLLRIFTFGATGAVDLITTTVEAATLDDEVEAILKEGQIQGQGTSSSTIKKLTTYNQNPDNVDDLLTVMKNTESLYSTSSGSSILKSLNNSMSEYTSTSNSLISSIASALTGGALSSGSDFNSRSEYSWGTVSKSTASLLNSLSGGTATGSLIEAIASTATSTSAAEAAASATSRKLAEMLDEDYILSQIEEGASYDDYVATAKNFGIADFSAALEDAGYDEDAVQQWFENLQTDAGIEKEEERNAKEEELWDTVTSYTEEMLSRQDEMKELMEDANALLNDIYEKHTDFYDAWVDYYVNHTAYNNAYDYSDVAAVQASEKSGSQDAVYALAEALTQNAVDLKDPQVQTNALLSQILIVLNAIMQQNNDTGSSLSLADTLSGLALGIVTKS